MAELMEAFSNLSDKHSFLGFIQRAFPVHCIRVTVILQNIMQQSSNTSAIFLFRNMTSIQAKEYSWNNMCKLASKAFLKKFSQIIFLDFFFSLLIYTSNINSGLKNICCQCDTKG